MEERRRPPDGEQERDIKVVLDEFYFKDVASKSVVNARSALPWSCKRTILIQEVLRILLTCSGDLPWKTVVGHVNHMMLRLQYSGYDQKFRTEIVRSALSAYNRLIELDASGEKQTKRLCRKLERARERRRRRENWCKKGGFDTVIFVPVTPGSQLKHPFIKEIKETGFRNMVVEQSGVTLESLLQKSAPFKEKQCRNIDCLVCQNNGKGPCRSAGVTYELVCRVCQNKYIGETLEALTLVSQGLLSKHSLKPRTEKLLFLGPLK